MGAVCVGWGLPAPPWWVRLADWVRAMFAKKETAPEPVVQADTCAAAERLLNQYGNAILRLAYSYLHNQADAEDMVQDTLMKYLQTAPKLDSPEHEKAWLLRVAANLSKNRIAYNQVRQADELDERLAAEGREDAAGAVSGGHPPVLLRGLSHRRDRPHLATEGEQCPVGSAAGTGEAEGHFEGGV